MGPYRLCGGASMSGRTIDIHWRAHRPNRRRHPRTWKCELETLIDGEKSRTATRTILGSRKEVNRVMNGMLEDEKERVRW